MDPFPLGPAATPTEQGRAVVLIIAGVVVVGLVLGCGSWGVRCSIEISGGSMPRATPTRVATDRPPSDDVKFDLTA